MFTSNPFAEISGLLSPNFMQVFVVIMVVLVAGGTLYDIIHKKSAKYFFKNWQQQKSSGARRVGGGEVAALAVRSVVVDGLLSGEFCNARRRIAHLLTMYGFLAQVIATAILVFCYPTTATPAPAIWPLIWYIGGLLVCIGGYWFWFFIRVDVAAEGHSPFRIVRADLFILSLLVSVTLGLVWGWMQVAGILGANIMFALYLIVTAVLYGSVPWSKFSHMFFKPAAALQKRIADADGSRSNLPAPADKPEIFGSNDRLPRQY